MNRISLIVLFFITSFSCNVQQEIETVDFLSDDWKTLGSAKVQMQDSKITTSISEGVGIAYLNGLEFENGIIECDLYSPTEKAYLGLVFRIGALDNFECVYFQPHTSGKWDAIQYDPIFNSSATWQLYHGNGYQAIADIPVQEWFHVKIMVFGDTAKVYLNNNENHSLAVKLKHNTKSGSVGVYSYHPANFKNLKITKTETSSDYQRQPRTTVEDELYISSWLISEPYDNYYHTIGIEELIKSVNKWHLINAEEDYLINLNRHFAKTNEENTVLAKVAINSTIPQTKLLNVGYSDKIRIFLNSEVLYSGDNSYKATGRHEDRGYVLDHTTIVEIPLQKGENELIFELSEDKFGWGFIARIDNLKGIKINE